jgi:ubiquinone biosynthesis UbiH/UbiF/VisC/COQ6 family hydroxylase
VSERDYDVLVVGGGMTGLAFTVLLRVCLRSRRSGLAIGVLESSPAPAVVVPPEVGLRVVALSGASRALLERCSVWQQLPAERVSPYQRMVVWQHEGDPGGRDAICFDAAEQGVRELGYIVENDLVRNVLWRQAAQDAGLELIAGAVPAALDCATDWMSVTLADGSRLRSRLLVGADGAASWLRDRLGIAVRRRPYGQQALVAHLRSERPHRATAWQRFLRDGPIALLPLADGRSSVVWSCPDSQARELLEMSDTAFGHALTGATDGVLGELTLSGERAGFALVGSHARAYTGSRYALIGDAAHRVHPLAGQGVNLGFLDAAALAEVLAAHLTLPRADAGDPTVLRRFERWRKGANLLTLGAMEALHQVFTSPWPLVPRAGAIGLGIVNQLGPVKRRLADYAIGRRGDVPRSARPGLNY